MNFQLVARVLVLVCLLFYSITASAQLFDFAKEDSYNQVFISTDDFDETYLETLLNAKNIIKNDTIRFKVLNDLAYYWHTRNLNTALSYTEEGLRSTILKGDSLWNARFKITQGSILLRMEKLVQAEQVLQEAAQIVGPIDKAMLYTQMGYVYERRGELDKAADYAMKTLAIGDSISYINAQAIAYSDLSNLFWKKSKFKEGLEFGLKSIKLYEEQGVQNLDYDFTLYVVGNNFLELKNYNKALEYYERSKIMGEQYGFYNNLSDVYISLIDLYTYLGNFEAAKQAGDNAIKYAELLENNFMIMRSWLSIGKLQVESKAFVDAIESLERSLEVATSSFGDEYYLSQAYDALSIAYYNVGNFEEAYANLLEAEKLKELLFTAESDQRISQIQTEFEVALKEDTIQIQEAKIEQQRIRQQLVWVISGFLLLLLVVLFVTYRKDKIKNTLLEKKNKEKEFLLKEIHHRVKNNLEVVSSLLSLQSAQLEDENAINAMEESQNRVLSMSMIHQRLYQGKDISVIEMKDYFIPLANHVITSFGVQNRVKFICQMEKIELDVDTAIPLGLIVNELFTNSLKYAFPNHKEGEIKLEFYKTKKDSYCLKVADNGIGAKQEIKKEGSGFGSQLIELLTQQLQGNKKVSIQDGTTVEIEF